MPKLIIEYGDKNRDYYAEAYYDTNRKTVTILHGSKMAQRLSIFSEQVKSIRNKVLEQGIVDNNGVFQRDYELQPEKQGGKKSALTPAARLIAGFDVNGWNVWKITGGDFPNYYNKSMQQWWNEYMNLNTKSEGELSTNIEQECISSSLNLKYSGQNVIFYGVPGCGKSHKIKEILTDLDEKYYKRILFHPEYAYSDFIGQLRPDVTAEKITYKFVPGPFTEILRDAYQDVNNNYYLVIEEINRGNAPAIFGDIFQLLDRGEDRKSEYKIYNKDILDYLNTKNIQLQSIGIPSNLTILATMNTCDQNVFTLDTAFKRRWTMSKIRNDFEKVSNEAIEFSNGMRIFWKEFALAVNDAILTNCNDGTEAEDKQLGAFFVRGEDITNLERFAEKVLMYLWDDVAKYDKSQLFDTNNYRTLDAVINGFIAGKNVFSPNCIKLKNLFDTAQNTESVVSQNVEETEQADGEGV